MVLPGDFFRPDYFYQFGTGVGLLTARDGTFQTVVCGWLPRCKHKVMIWPLVGCSRLSGLLMQSVRLLALMVSANKVRSA